MRSRRCAKRALRGPLSRVGYQARFAMGADAAVVRQTIFIVCSGWPSVHDEDRQEVEIECARKATRPGNRPTLEVAGAAKP